MFNVASVALDFSAFANPPGATYAIVGIALALGTMTSYIGVRSMDMGAYRKLTIESHKARNELMEATKEGNQRKISKAQQRQQDLMAQQNKLNSSRLRSSMFFTLPLILIWQPLRTFFGDSVIAYFPFNVPYIPREFKFYQWYLLCSFTFNLVLNRVFGLTFEIDPED